MTSIRAFGRSPAGAGASADRPRRRRRSTLLVAIVVGAAAATVAGASSIASFTDSSQSTADVSAARIFPGSRTTTGFSIGDMSAGGSSVDQSSPLAFASDGRTLATGAWSTAFAGDRYLQFDLNAPLPAGVDVSAVTFRLTLSSAGSSGTACVYVEVRRISDDGVLATYGSSGSPVGCVSGATLTLVTQSLGAISTTDAANDLRVRVYGSDSAGLASVLDEATVRGSTPYASFTLYPVRYTDAASANRVSIPWALQGP